jgi:guanylate kinase
MADLGNLYVIAAPSGTGKTSLVKAVVDSLPKVTVSVSHTTRAKRPNEVDGVNYYFISKDVFERMVSNQDFLEYATVFDNFYGTSKQWVKETLNKGIDVILEIDWQGHQQIKQLFPSSISIFILPPSLDDLKTRLMNRNQDNADIIKKRLADAKATVSHLHEFDYIVINDDFIQAVHDLKLIIEAGRLRQKRQTAKFSHLLEKLAGV